MKRLLWRLVVAIGLALLLSAGLSVVYAVFYQPLSIQETAVLELNASSTARSFVKQLQLKHATWSSV